MCLVDHSKWHGFGEDNRRRHWNHCPGCNIMGVAQVCFSAPGGAALPALMIQQLLAISRSADHQPPFLSAAEKARNALEETKAVAAWTSAATAKRAAQAKTAAAANTESFQIKVRLRKAEIAAQVADTRLKNSMLCKDKDAVKHATLIFPEACLSRREERQAGGEFIKEEHPGKEGEGADGFSSRGAPRNAGGPTV